MVPIRVCGLERQGSGFYGGFGLPTFCFTFLFFVGWLEVS